MKFLSYFRPNIFIFGLTLCGYGLISFLVSNPDSSQSITIPFRLTVLALNILLITCNLGIVNSKFFAPSVSKRSPVNPGIIIFLWKIYLWIYSLRLIYDVYLRTDISLFRASFEYPLYWFFIALLPGINFFFLDKSNYYKYLIITWQFHLIIGILVLYINPESNERIALTGRLSGNAFNSIALGQYGTSLFLLSIIIWLRYSHVNLSASSIVLKTKFNFFYLGGAIIGLIATMLSASRSAVTTLIVCILVIIMTSKKVSYRLTFFLIFFLSSTILSASFALSRGSFFIDRMFLIEEEFSPDGNRRGGLHNIAFKAISENLFTGYGIELPDGRGYPHNIFIESFLALGLFGGMIFMIVVGYALIKSLKMLNNPQSKWSWLSILFIQNALLNCSSGALYVSFTFWYLLFAILGVNSQDSFANSEFQELEPSLKNS